MERGEGYVDCNLYEVEDSFSPCQRQDCHHHFSWGMRFDKRVGRHPVGFTETEESRKSLNCMRLLREPLTQVEIAEMFGVTRQLIFSIEKSALQHFRDNLLLLLDN